MELLRSYEDLEHKALEMGFLPFFRNAVKGFSVEEMTPSEYWFSDDVDGPWEWKGPVVRNWQCTYGKLFCGKAVYASLQWFPELVNYRRSLYNPALPAPDGTDRSRDLQIYQTVVAHESLLSKEIKALCGYQRPRTKPVDMLDRLASAPKPRRQPGHESYDTVMTRLQMGTYLVIADFEYLHNAQGEPYGWGLARYVTPEALFGKERILSCSDHSPEESKRRIVNHLMEVLPQATERQILKLIAIR
jgi:hypothetical protein